MTESEEVSKNSRHKQDFLHRLQAMMVTICFENKPLHSEVCKISLQGR